MVVNLVIGNYKKMGIPEIDLNPWMDDFVIKTVP
jgi:hypothetical protein